MHAADLAECLPSQMFLDLQFLRTQIRKIWFLALEVLLWEYYIGKQSLSPIMAFVLGGRLLGRFKVPLRTFSHQQIFTLVSTVDNSNVLDSKGSHPLSASFQENALQMGTLVHELDTKIAQIIQGGGQKATDRNRSRGKMLPRERIQALLDPGSPFLELSQLAGFGLYGT